MDLSSLHATSLVTEWYSPPLRSYIMQTLTDPEREGMKLMATSFQIHLFVCTLPAQPASQPATYPPTMQHHCLMINSHPLVKISQSGPYIMITMFPFLFSLLIMLKISYISSDWPWRIWFMPMLYVHLLDNFNHTYQAHQLHACKVIPSC